MNSVADIYRAALKDINSRVQSTISSKKLKIRCNHQKITALYIKTNNQKHPNKKSAVRTSDMSKGYAIKNEFQKYKFTYQIQEISSATTKLLVTHYIMY